MRAALALTLLAVAAFGVASAKLHTRHHHNGLTAEAAADKITSLPGLSATPSFQQFAGYLTVDEKNGRKLFYWFVESQSNPSSDPIFWWSNGGPGCSGLIGFMTEHGPFSPMSDGATLQTNPNSWNLVANMLYIEAPAGVGFSYSNVESDYTVGDARTASDNYLGILAFLQKFPQYNSTDFYLSSESYGGHYAPTLAVAILKGNAAGKNPRINFRGVLDGNPYTNPFENDIGAYATFHGHGLISSATWNSLNQHCFVKPDASCGDWEGQATDEVGDLDPYGLDYPVCLNGAEAKQFLRARNGGAAKNAALRYPYDPCIDDYTTTYLNRPDVIAAIHANPNLGYAWAECSSVLNYNMSDMNVDMVPIWKELIADGSLHLTVFSGDDDSVCGLLGTQYWVSGMNLQVTSPWASWTDSTGQVGGYLTQYAGFNLVTVHNAGHMVATFQPERALDLFKGYIAGTF